MTQTETESWTPFTLTEIADVPGARVIDAWLVTGAGARTATLGFAGETATVDEHLATVLETPADARLPQRVTSDGPAALLVLWQIDDCTALERDIDPVATLRNVIGATTTDALPYFTAPDPSFFTTQDPPITDAGFADCPRE